jgi:DNA-binding GntR family transcriptional regulator
MIECWAIDLLKNENIRDLPEVEAALASTSGLSIPSRDEKEEILRYLQTIIAYHTKLIESSGNRWLIHFHNSIHSSLTRYQFIYAHIHGRSTKYKKDHKEILAWIKRGDYEKAKRLLRSHIHSVVDILEKNIRSSETQSHPQVR